MTAFNMQTTGGPTVTLVRERTSICDRSTHICEWGLSCIDTIAAFGTAGRAQDCGGQVHSNTNTQSQSTSCRICYTAVL